jgi:hypothetical protein
MPMSTKCALLFAVTAAVVQLPLLPTKQVELANGEITPGLDVSVSALVTGEQNRPAATNAPADIATTRPIVEPIERYFRSIDNPLLVLVQPKF